MKIGYLLLLPALVACTHMGLKEPYQSKKEAVTVMAYNMENLFDTENDPDKNDETFLPLALKQNEFHKAICRNQPERYQEDCLYLDWSKKTLRRKMQRLADVILQVKDGRGPDVLIVEEVENQKVLAELNHQFLQKAGYKNVLVPEGPDARGIDVGLMTRLPVVGKPKMHKIKFTKVPGMPEYYLKKNTRTILQVDLKLPNGDTLSVFGVHFPSGAAPTLVRSQAIDNLQAIVDKLPKDRLVIVGGDFNINIMDDVKEGLYGKKLSQKWEVSHYYNTNLKVKGTHYYHFNRTWSFLDALIFKPNMSELGNANWKVVRNSVRVPNYSYYQSNQWDSPARYRMGKYSVGVSDHWPIALDLVPRNTPKVVKTQEVVMEGAGNEELN